MKFFCRSALEDAAVREEYLTERKGKKVAILGSATRRQAPAGAKWRRRTRVKVLPSGMTRKRRGRRCCASCRRSLRLKRYPQRIECYDISTIHGAHAVGSMVTFINGEPDKSPLPPLSHPHHRRRFRRRRFRHDARGAQAPFRARQRGSRSAGSGRRRRRQGATWRWRWRRWPKSA